jgi:anthranilate phosphoribosyltransferase
VVHGHDGLDEISVCAPTRVSELADGRIRTYDIRPEPFFGEPAEPEALSGGSPEENAGITRALLNGEKGPRRNVVLINAAAALVAADRAETLSDGIRLAGEAIDSGAARGKLEQLVAFTREHA